MSKSKKVVHAGFELVHLALPPGLKPGEGLGAKVLGAVRNCDAILVVLARVRRRRASPADPAGDLDALELEFVMADLDSVEQRLNRQRRAAKSGDKEIAAEVGALERAHAALSDGTPLARAALEPGDLGAAGAGVLPHDQADARRAQHGRAGRRRCDRRDRSRHDRGPDRHRSRDRRVRAGGPRRHARDVRRHRVGARHGRAGGVPPARPAHVSHDR